MVETAITEHSYSFDTLVKEVHELYGNFPLSSVQNYRPGMMPLWRKALANVRTGTANATIACLGDSLFNGTGSTGFRTTSSPKYLADQLVSAGVPALNLSTFFGSGVLSAGGLLNDTRFAATGPWATHSSAQSVGGNVIYNSGSAGTLSFTMSPNVDTVTLFWLGDASSNFTVNIDGGGALLTVTNGNGHGDFNIYQSTFSFTAGANHVMNIVWVSGTIWIIGAKGYLSTQKSVSVLNLGTASAAASDLANVSALYSSRNALAIIAPDLTILQSGAVDWINGKALAQFIINLQSVITTALISGDVLISTSSPTAVAVNSLLTQQSFVNATKSLAIANNLPYVDWNARCVSYELLTSLVEASGDNVHINALAYNDHAAALIQAVIPG
jgi:hypothetical protein